MYYIVVTVFEYRYNCSEYGSWYNMDSFVNGSKWDLLYVGKWCLPKNAICVMYNVRYISILDYRFFNF